MDESVWKYCKRKLSNTELALNKTNKAILHVEILIALNPTGT